MATTKKKRKMSAAQKAALAKGRRALAAKRKGKAPAKKRKAPVAKKKTAARKTAKRKTVKRSTPPMARKKKRTSGGVKRKARRAVSRAKGFLKGAGLQEIVFDAGTAVAGGVAAGFLANKIPVADPRIKSAMPIVGGIVLAATIGKKNKIARGIGTGMVVLGAVSVIKQMAPNVPMLAGETDYYIPDYGALPYAGEMVDLGQDFYDDDEDDLGTMGETVDLGEEVYVSPASL